jgi:GAF domain-containing protein
MTTELNKSPPQHTPVPYCADHATQIYLDANPGDVLTVIEISVAYGTAGDWNTIAYVHDEKDAKFIARACNSHYPLLKAAQDLLDYLSTSDEAKSWDSFSTPNFVIFAAHAIDKARGQQ